MQVLGRILAMRPKRSPRKFKIRRGKDGDRYRRKVKRGGKRDEHILC